MRHVGQEDRSRGLGSRTSEVRNTERYLRAAKPGIRLGTRAEEWQKDWSGFMDGVKFQHSFILKAFLFLFDDGMQLLPKLIC